MISELLTGFSLEMSGKDVAGLHQASLAIPPGTSVNVTFLGSEDSQLRLAAVRAVTGLRLLPVPHIAARRLESEAELKELLSSLRCDRAFVVGGDPVRPHGPYADALAVIGSGHLEAHGIQAVAIAGYPEGHPAIPDDVLWSALLAKAAAIGERGLAGSIITQFGFDADRVLDWIALLRQRGVALPVRVGVPGPAGIRRLLSYASRFGVATSAGIARKYGLSITSLMGTAGPDRFLRDLAAGYEPARHGDVKLHFYTFGGLAVTAEWITEFRAVSSSESRAESRTEFRAELGKAN